MAHTALHRLSSAKRLCWRPMRCTAQSAGREHPEPDHPYRGPFQRDRDRIVHSAGLSPAELQDASLHRRTGRLSPHAADAHAGGGLAWRGRIGRALALNEDLIEALALVHDLGHPPFGHCRRRRARRVPARRGRIFAQRPGLRIVAELEMRYHDFPGLNLSREVLEGQATRIARRSPADSGRCWKCKSSRRPTASPTTRTTPTTRWSSGLLTLDELLTHRLWAAAAAARPAALARRSRPDELRRAVLHELIDWQVGDLLGCGQRAGWPSGDIDSPAGRRGRPSRSSWPAASWPSRKNELEAFLAQPRLSASRRACASPRGPGMLARDVRRLSGARRAVAREFSAPGRPRSASARSVGDYLAGMTDRFASANIERLLLARERARAALVTARLNADAGLDSSNGLPAVNMSLAALRSLPGTSEALLMALVVLRFVFRAGGRRAGRAAHPFARAARRTRPSCPGSCSAA